jgi:energy-converting hydrogenase Eha subunit A|tara:strand:- start:2431 stop:2655 length:225 start_codon:yes stop_codon:yes gene_type:complete
MEQLKTISTLIVALATAAIVSMDLGLPYSENEKRVYTSAPVQTVAVAAVAYSVTEDVQQAIVITMAWWAIKNSS